MGNLSVAATEKTGGLPGSTPRSSSSGPRLQQHVAQQNGDHISKEGVSTQNSDGYNQNVSDPLQSRNTRDKISKGELRLYVALVAIPLIALAAALFIKYVIWPVWPKPPPGWPTGSTS
jgi:hypothetical protein